jgi:hypothetical protein
MDNPAGTQPWSLASRDDRRGIHRSLRRPIAGLVATGENYPAATHTAAKAESRNPSSLFSLFFADEVSGAANDFTVMALTEDSTAVY